jgi:hypothetical protein
MLLFLLVCLQCVAALNLEVQVYCPASGIRNLPSGAVFSLALCHVKAKGCPSTGAWNFSVPGMPYDLAHELTIFNARRPSQKGGGNGVGQGAVTN